MRRDQVQGDPHQQQEHHHQGGLAVGAHQLPHARQHGALVDAARADIAGELEHHGALGATARIGPVVGMDDDRFALEKTVELARHFAKAVRQAVAVAQQVHIHAIDAHLEQARANDVLAAELAGVFDGKREELARLAAVGENHDLVAGHRQPLFFIAALPIDVGLGADQQVFSPNFLFGKLAG